MTKTIIHHIIFSSLITKVCFVCLQDVKIKEENFEPTARRLPTRGEQSSNKETRCVDVERQQCGEGSGTENNCNVTADLAPQPEAGHSSSLEDTSATQVDRYNATDGWRCKDCNKTFTTDHHLIGESNDQCFMTNACQLAFLHVNQLGSLFTVVPNRLVSSKSVVLIN